MLEKLVLGENYLTDEGLALVNNSRRLKELHLDPNRSVSEEGWISFSTVLLSPHSVLEKLNLNRNLIKDEIMISFANYRIGN
jgi:hypothetical protein